MGGEVSPPLGRPQQTAVAAALFRSLTVGHSVQESYRNRFKT
jgi:hypothetical protein